MLRAYLTNSKYISCVLCMALFIVFVSSCNKQSNDKSLLEPRVAIIEVFVDIDSRVIEIFGENFNLGPNELVVSLGDKELEILTQQPDFIVVEIPEELEVGDYTLKVQSGQGERKQDQEIVTVEAVGPQGDPGDPGDQEPGS